MNHQMMHPDELDADADDLANLEEIEYEESDGIETAVEVEQLLAQVRAARFSDAGSGWMT